MTSRPRTLIVSRNLPPLTGGMERLNHHLIEQLAAHFECTVVGPHGSDRPGIDGVAWHACGPRSAASVAAFLTESFLRAARLGLRHRDGLALAIATSGLTAPAALAAARVSGARAAVLVHGLDLVAESAVYRRLFLPAVRMAHRVIANSRNTARLAQDIGVAPERIAVVHPGVDLPMTPAPAGFRQRHGLGKRKVLLSVGRLVKRKGLAEFIQRCMPALVASHPDLVLAVVGAEATDAIRSDGSIAAGIVAAAERQGLEDHVHLCGRLDDDALHAAYSESDVFVFPLIPVAGDVEGFGMVAIEAAAHGLSTVAFAEGGVTDAVEPGVSGALVPAGDYAAFAERVVEALAGAGAESRAAACRGFAARFSWERYGEAVRDSLHGALGPPAREDVG